MQQARLQKYDFSAVTNMLSLLFAGKPRQFKVRSHQPPPPLPQLLFFSRPGRGFRQIFVHLQAYRSGWTFFHSKPDFFHETIRVRFSAHASAAHPRQSAALSPGYSPSAAPRNACRMAHHTGRTRLACNQGAPAFRHAAPAAGTVRHSRPPATGRFQYRFPANPHTCHYALSLALRALGRRPDRHPRPRAGLRPPGLCAA
ncbi:unknown [Prevotella sp. CAG:617]|nr:unknown [Prevotella sp. CAG:617]